MFLGIYAFSLGCSNVSIKLLVVFSYSFVISVGISCNISSFISDIMSPLCFFHEFSKMFVNFVYLIKKKKKQLLVSLIFYCLFVLCDIFFLFLDLGFVLLSPVP